MVEELHSLINAPRKISSGSQKVHSITNEILTREPSPEHVFPKFQAFMNGSVLVAHNARFDMSFLKAEFHRLGLSVADRYRCTNKLSGKLCPKLTHYFLLLACWYKFGALPEGSHLHRSLDDTRLTVLNWIRSTEMAK